MPPPPRRQSSRRAGAARQTCRRSRRAPRWFPPRRGRAPGRQPPAQRPPGRRQGGRRGGSRSESRPGDAWRGAADTAHERHRRQRQQGRRRRPSPSPGPPRPPTRWRKCRPRWLPARQRSGCGRPAGTVRVPPQRRQCWRSPRRLQRWRPHWTAVSTIGPGPSRRPSHPRPRPFPCR
ncbi:hypothetical protein BU14_0115s0022 [Porphyra umbilicalis]|uniref:Uncharacterized protein n=1 Tax=Porphyra umbilicalis TaxID=2786 RepID=A0A1X6PBI5_PORUM|nr:hypothetical protein BU14_0115s0022 [Porphyra umbilicalis]|eukprot:OSX78251.1 hypothetical protein BU14_0115s0022 [Porphyra umbilicalis]